MDTITLAAVLTTAGASIAGGLVAGVVQLVKPMLPDTWSTGRAPMILSALLALVITAGALSAAGLGFGWDAAWIGLLTWYGVYGAAIAGHATVRKVVNVARGTTNPTGPDSE